MMDKLKRVVATGGNFHHELIPKHLLPKDSRDNDLQIIDEIPCCCRVALRGNESPLTVFIKYESAQKKGQPQTPGANDLKVFIS